MQSPTELVHAFARGHFHPGYIWAAVCADGELLCRPCVRGNYRLVLKATAHPSRQNEDWRVIGLTNSGESEQQESCVHCGKLLWELN